jgi:hypothetical protein
VAGSGSRDMVPVHDHLQRAVWTDGGGVEPEATSDYSLLSLRGLRSQAIPTSLAYKQMLTSPRTSL